ncbi:MAG: ABC transporter permease [Rickettsiales bacterium]|jgi:putative ABC transport system permease protein|nr:ABC transporter permease [Rickettsiales bacterium]
MFFLTLRESWISLYSSKLRTFLTILGVVIGICSVILMVAAGQAVQLEINKQLAGFGSNQLIIMPASPSKNGVRGPRGGRPTLTLSDMESLRGIKGVVSTSPVVQSSYQITGNGNNWPTTVYGTNTDFLISQNYEIAKGSMFTERDVYANSSVAVIGNTVAQKIFLDLDPVGRDIKIKGVPFKVIGVLKGKGAGFGGEDEDDLILLPVKSFKSRLTTNRFPDRIYSIMVTFDDVNQMKMIERRIQSLLEERHKISTNRDPDFEIINLTEILDRINMISLILTILLTSIASISLIVGSIGIMNMMLTSVMERTREIGIRKALGATNNNIVVQFLGEAIFISALGGFLGMILGISISQAVGYLIGYEVPISILTILVSIFSSLFVGVFSGISPAFRAAKLNPIDALRYQ